jgi:hypothetical protein
MGGAIHSYRAAEPGKFVEFGALASAGDLRLRWPEFHRFARAFGFDAALCVTPARLTARADFGMRLANGESGQQRRELALFLSDILS